MNSLPPPPTAPLNLSEQRLLNAYRQMDADCQRSILPIVEAWANKFPGHHAPVLRLVSGGAI